MNLILRNLLLLGCLCGLTCGLGCSGGTEPTEEDHRKAAEISLMYEHEGVLRLQQMAKNPRSFQEEMEAGAKEPSEFQKQLTATLENLKNFPKGGQHEQTVNALIAKLEEIQAKNPTKPSAEVTKAVDEAVEIADKLPKDESDD